VSGVDPLTLLADPLTAWLVEKLADAGYKKLTTLVRGGSDQHRALRKAVGAAVQATAEEISGSHEQEADRLAKLISGAFGKSAPVKLLPGQLTGLERLYAAIAQQLSVLDDGGQPAPGPLGVPVAEVAQSLADHLVGEIKDLGALGGPLTPLAARLDADQTLLKVEEVKTLLAQMLGELQDKPTPAGNAEGPPGQPLAEVLDPFALEVHRPIEPDVPQPGLPALPAYVPREHDAALAKVVMTAAAAGTSGIAVLVGGSSTGKTRACWQALELLRNMEPAWRLWHPINPQGALAGLAGVEPRTVVWLNEAQNYLRTADGAGEWVAAGLRELLRDRDRGPVLVLATLWPDYWTELTVRPAGGLDPHAQARELLAGHDIPVPGAFTDEQLRQLEEAGDPRLAQAAAGSRDGQVIQYLAGAPELLDRYRTASPAARALIDAAMDAARMGMRPALPRAFLEAAAPGYLTGTEWDLLGDDWLEEGLAYTKRSAKGVRGPLAPIRPRPAPGAPASPGTGTTWQLADYLDQHGRRARREEIPPEAFWAAAASYADLADQASLGEAAERRGLYRNAARLYRQASSAAEAGWDSIAGAGLVRLLHDLDPGDHRPAEWVTAHASLDDPFGVAGLLRALHDAGAAGQVTAVASRAVAQASLDDPVAVASLVDALREAGAAGQVSALLDRDLVAQVSLDDPGGVAILVAALADAGAAGQVTALASRAAAEVSLDDPVAVASLVDALREAGAAGQVTVLLDRDPAAQVSLDDPAGVARLLHHLLEAGADGQVTVLLDRDPAAHASLDDLGGVAILLAELRRAGADGQVTARLARLAEQAGLDDPLAVGDLLWALRWADTAGQVTVLLDRDPAAHASLDDPRAVTHLLRALLGAGAAGQVTVLLDRDPAAQVSLDHPGHVAMLLELLHEAGANGQAAELASRAAARASLVDDSAYAVETLLEAVREAGTVAQAAELIERLPVAGWFELFRLQEGRAELFRFGREADGRPAEPWGWTDVSA
jgi:hypothetical protein